MNRITLPLWVLGLIAICGCEPAVKQVPVSGTVIYQGATVADASVVVHYPDGSTAVGMTDKQGVFTLTYNGQNGALPGKELGVTVTKSLSPYAGQSMLPLPDGEPPMGGPPGGGGKGKGKGKGKVPPAAEKETPKEETAPPEGTPADPGTKTEEAPTPATPPNGTPPTDPRSKVIKQGKNLLPAKYADFNNPVLKIDVPEGGTDKLQIILE